MQTEEMSMKSKIIYIVFVCFITLLIWLGDEGHRPLAYTGSELLHSVGLIDSEYGLVIREAVSRNGAVINLRVDAICIRTSFFSSAPMRSR